MVGPAVTVRFAPAREDVATYERLGDPAYPQRHAIEHVEPWLFQRGLVRMTPGGRTAGSYARLVGVAEGGRPAAPNVWRSASWKSGSWVRGVQEATITRFRPCSRIAAMICWTLSCEQV